MPEEHVEPQWSIIRKFKMLNWNVAGAKFLDEKEGERDETQKKLNDALWTLIQSKKPDIVTLQELVQWAPNYNDVCNNIKTEIKDIINDEKILKEYNYYFYPFIDVCRLSAKDKWDKVIENGGWDKMTYFAQGNGFLIKKEYELFPVLSLREPNNEEESDTPKQNEKQKELANQEQKRNYVEQINFESGLYMGNRDTERRAALIAHFILETKIKQTKPKSEGGHPDKYKPLDVFIINTHLTTLTREREGIPKIDYEASQHYRMNQLDIIFQGIISRYNEWRRLNYPNRGKSREFSDNETSDRFEPIWIIAGDFNFMPESKEYNYILSMNFIDLIPGKKTGSKAPGFGKPPTITLDYIFAGPKYVSLDPVFTKNDIKGNHVYDEHEEHIRGVSDHYPMFANVPIRIPGENKCIVCGAKIN